MIAILYAGDANGNITAISTTSMTKISSQNFHLAGINKLEVDANGNIYAFATSEGVKIII